MSKRWEGSERSAAYTKQSALRWRMNERVTVLVSVKIALACGIGGRKAARARSGGA